MFEKLYPVKLYFRALPNLIAIGSSFLLNATAWFWLFWNIKPQEAPIFLHYNILFGVDYIGEWWKIIFLPAAGFSILALNAILGWVLFSRDRFIAYTLNAASVLCQVFLLIITSLLIFLNV